MDIRKRQSNRERQRRWRYRRRISKVLPQLELNLLGQEALIAAGYLDADLRQDRAAVGRAILRALEDALAGTVTANRPAERRIRHGK